MTTDDDLVVNNLDLANKLAWKLYKKYSSLLEFEDIQSLCYLGLVKASKLYNEELGFKFSTYAYKSMLNEVFNYLRQNKNTFNELSLNQIVLDTDDTELIEFIKIYIDFDEILIKKDLLLKLKNSINNLTELEKQIIRMKLKGDTQLEIADKLGVSQPQICRLLRQIINKLRNQFIEELGVEE